MTYQELINKLEQIASAHFSVNQVDSGVLESLDYKNNRYPMVFFITNLAEFRNNTIAYQIMMLVGDKTDLEMTQQITVQSNMFQITKDIVSYLLNGDFNAPWISLETISTEPFVDNLPDLISGWMTTFTIVMPYDNSGCELPFDINLL